MAYRGKLRRRKVTNFLGSDEIVNNKETNDENYSSTKFFLIRYTVYSFIFCFLFQNKAIGDVCLPNPCENGGLCHHGVDGKLFSCECPHGFLGLRCECKFLLFSFSCVYMVTWWSWLGSFELKRLCLKFLILFLRIC